MIIRYIRGLSVRLASSDTTEAAVPLLSVVDRYDFYHSSRQSIIPSWTTRRLIAVIMNIGA
jgi:hypothetical protein